MLISHGVDDLQRRGRFSPVGLDVLEPRVQQLTPNWNDANLSDFTEEGFCL